MPQKHTPVVLRKTQSLAFNMTAGHGCWRSHCISTAVLSLAWHSELGRTSEPLHSIPSIGASSPTCRETNLWWQFYSETILSNFEQYYSEKTSFSLQGNQSKSWRSTDATMKGKDVPVRRQALASAFNSQLKDLPLLLLDPYYQQIQVP